MNRSFPLLALLLGAGLAACANQNRAKPQAGVESAAESGAAAGAEAPAESVFYGVTAKRAALFYHSPMQPKGPDAGLPQGAEVELIRREAIYSWVRLDNGREAYIANDEIKPLPPRPVIREEDPVFQLRVSPSPDNPGRLQIVPLDEMINATEPPLPVSEPPAGTTDSATPSQP